MDAHALARCSCHDAPAIQPNRHDFGNRRRGRLPTMMHEILGCLIALGNHLVADLLGQITHMAPLMDSSHSSCKICAALSCDFSWAQADRILPSIVGL